MCMPNRLDGQEMPESAHVPFVTVYLPTPSVRECAPSFQQVGDTIIDLASGGSGPPDAPFAVDGSQGVLTAVGMGVVSLGAGAGLVRGRGKPARS